MAVRSIASRRRIYDKLFFGNNLPAITPEGEHYTPTWDEQEVDSLRDIMAAGLKMFRGNLDRNK